jgi:hypothetical protein
MRYKNLVRRVRNLERQRNSPNYTVVWKDQHDRYRVNGETLDDVAYQRWRAQQGSNKIVCICAWR